MVNETIKDGQYYRRCIDKLNAKWERISFWHKASDCEFNNGIRLEDKYREYNNVTVSADDFVSDATYGSFKFRAQIPLDGVTEDHSPDVRFSGTDANGKVLGKFSESYDGGVYIYATRKPEEDIIIPTIICTRVK